jgi:hypothetical protein
MSLLQYVEEENVEAAENDIRCDPEGIQSVDEVLRILRMMRRVSYLYVFCSL